jgi:hypothetical protein
MWKTSRTRGNSRNEGGVKEREREKEKDQGGELGRSRRRREPQQKGNGSEGGQDSKRGELTVNRGADGGSARKERRTVGKVVGPTNRVDEALVEVVAVNDTSAALVAVNGALKEEISGLLRTVSEQKATIEDQSGRIDRLLKMVGLLITSTILGIIEHWITANWKRRSIVIEFVEMVGGKLG